MTKISWTDKSINTITGCTPISEGCKNCYAKAMHKRLAAMGQEKYSKPFSEIVTHPKVLKRVISRQVPTKYFVNSMSDTFHEDVPYNHLTEIFNLMSLASQHTFQVLTKRPENMLKFMEYFYGEYVQKNDVIQNVWLGTSVENQTTANERIPYLLKTPAKVRFLSVEPMLEQIDLSKFLFYPCGASLGIVHNCSEKLRRVEINIDWVIVGCESGHGKRECKIEWIENIVEQCEKACVPVWVKQLNINRMVKKEVEDFPKHLQIQQFPEVK